MPRKRGSRPALSRGKKHLSVGNFSYTDDEIADYGCWDQGVHAGWCNEEDKSAASKQGDAAASLASDTLGCINETQPSLELESIRHDNMVLEAQLQGEQLRHAQALRELESNHQELLALKATINQLQHQNDDTTADLIIQRHRNTKLQKALETSTAADLEGLSFQQLSELGSSYTQALVRVHAQLERAAKQMAIDAANRAASEAEAEAEAVSGGQQCTICMDALTDILLVPCRHICVCSKCLKAHNIKVCPICRLKVYKTKQVFFA